MIPEVWIVFCVSILVFVISLVVCSGVWVYRDAKRRGLNAVLWTAVVVLSGNFIGLILYLLIGRKEEMAACPQCRAKVTKQGVYCMYCGNKLGSNTFSDQQPNKIKKSYKKLIAAFVMFIVLIFIAVAGMMFFIFTQEGFTPNYRTSYYSYSGSNGYAKMLQERSSGDTWSLAFEEADSGYVFSNTYNSKDNTPGKLSVDVRQLSGTVELIITQGAMSIQDKLSAAGMHNYSLSGFKPGKIKVTVINIDAENFESVINITTK